ncbi:capsid assembly scaffolding protein Gp46 family protein, partial [Enterococcus faecalis]
EAQKFVQSQSQSAADKQLEAWKQNNLEKIKETTIKEYEESKKNKTPEQIKLEELQAEFEAEKALRVTSDNKAFVAEKIAGLDWDGDLKDSISQFMLNNLVSSDTEFTKKAVEGFTELLEAINDKHAEAIKNVEMTKAFGNKSQQTNMGTGNQTKSFENPEVALGQKLQAFID